MSNRGVLLLSGFILLAGGCAARYDDAVVLAEQGRFVQAAAKYKSFAFKQPSAPEAPRALLAAADIYALRLGACGESRPLLERLAREYPFFKMPEDVFRRIFICPDYFPAEPGRKWTYGDSQTFGRNARQEAQVTGRAAEGAVISDVFYAGRALVSRRKKTCRFSGMNFMERQDRTETLLLSYPLEAGKAWASAGPEGRLEFLVEKTGLKVKVKAGEFENCVKIRRRSAGMLSWILEYYAPWTGKILTSVAGKGYEHRVTELIAYEEKK